MFYICQKKKIYDILNINILVLLNLGKEENSVGKERVSFLGSGKKAFIFKVKEIRWYDIDGNWHTSFLYLICDKKDHFGILKEEGRVQVYRIGRCDNNHSENYQNAVEMESIFKEIKKLIKD
ncbi:MAG: hypothetical protein ACPLXL_01155 [Minisyncoccia bacterium]